MTDTYAAPTKRGRKNKKETSNAARLVEKNVKSSTKQSPGWLTDLRYGRSLSVDFFKNNAWLLLLIIVLTVSLIGLRYKTKTKMGEIKRLEKSLSQAESEKLREKSEYMSLIRETEMLRLVQEKHLGLEFQEAPPYEVELVDN